MATALRTPVKLEYPATEGELELRIEAGACRLTLSPATGEAWVCGSYRDPSGTIQIATTVTDNRGSIKVGRSAADALALLGGIPELDLQLGKARPMAITIAAGASENQLELGGLPITRLEVNHGAGSLEVRCSEPIPVRTGQVKFGVGAGKTEVFGLGYLNFEELSLEGGAASCVLDFSGRGLQSAAVRIATAMASVELRIPSALAAEVSSGSLVGRPSADGGFIRRGQVWLNQAAANGAPPQLRIRSNMVMGRLLLTTIV